METPLPVAESAENAARSGHSHLQRRFGLLQAVALNMANMVGVGPFITIPLLLAAMGGPQAMLGWFIAALVTIPDGMVWSELGAAMPGSGGSYVYLREGFGREKWGRLVAFLFIWQFIISGPMEIASGYIGFGGYLSYIWPQMTDAGMKWAAAGAGLLTIILLYRRITFISRLTVALWIGTILTTAAVIFSGVPHFGPKVAFDFPPDAFKLSGNFWIGLGAATRIGIYDYLGYYDICYIGDEVKNPGRVIPRSIMISLIGVALIYFTMNLSIIGVVPWRELTENTDSRFSKFIGAIFMEKLYGSRVATVFTLMILWTGFASVFALLLGYSRIPFAAAQDGYFFKVFGKLHPTKDFPYVSLVVIGAIAIVCSFFSLQVVIDALVPIRILVQFIGQIFALTLLRRLKPDMHRPYKMWLYPIPSAIAFLGWVFVYATSGKSLILYGLGGLALGVVVFLIWSRASRQWPFAPQAERA